ncbi:MAG: TonB-dependent receptor [Bacteroidota bacterium]
MNSMKLKLLSFSVLYLLFLSSVIAQEATLSGIVSAKASNEPLIGASVIIAGKGATTDLNGAFELKIPAGDYQIEVSYIGFETISEKISLNSGESRQLNFSLDEEATLLNAVTVTSGKYEKPLGEVTVSMEVIKPRLLDAVNSTSIDEVLEKIPGVSIVDGQANIRGGSGWSYGAGSRVLLLVDDIPALQADAGFPNWDDIPVEHVGQMEVIKGASSALYGSSALNGIINVRTAYATSKPVTKAALFYNHSMKPKDESRAWWGDGVRAPYETGISFSHRQKIKKLDLVAGGYGLYRRSFNQTSTNRYGRLSFATQYRATDRLTFGMNGNFNKGEGTGFFYWRDGESGAYQPDSTTLTSSERFRYNLTPFINYFDKSGNRHRIQGRYNGIINDNSDAQSNSSSLLYSEYQFQRRFEGIDLVYTAGVVGIISGVTSELYGDTTYNTTNLSAYMQFEKKFFDRLNISLGARYERNTIEGPELVGTDTIPGGEATEAKPVFRLGLNYQASESTFLRASWGQGYRFPTLAEKYIETVAGFIRVFPNPDLSSETGWSAEIGIKQGLRLGGWQGYVDAALFWMEYEDMMEFTFDGRLFGFQSRNVGNTVIKGIDLSVAGEGKLLGGKTYVLAGYTYIDPRFKEFTAEDSLASSADYNILKYRFRHAVKADIQTTYNRLTVGAELIYNSEMEAVDRVLEFVLPGVRDFRENNRGGYLLLGARIGYQVTPFTKLSFIGRNLTNKAYSDRPGQLQAPRNVTMRLDVEF